MKTKLEKAILESMVNNPNNWNGIFYRNRNDLRVVVSRPGHPGRITFNWANSWSYVAFGFILLITIAGIIFGWH